MDTYEERGRRKRTELWKMLNFIFKQLRGEKGERDDDDDGDEDDENYMHASMLSILRRLADAGLHDVALASYNHQGSSVYLSISSC